ncbi:MAG: extracellular solute-binding protein [Chloroflexota bacterium]
MIRPYLCVIIIIILVGCESVTLNTDEILATDVPVVDRDFSEDFIIWGNSGLTDTVDQYMNSVFEERYPDLTITFIDAGWDEALRLNLENAIQMGRPPEVVIGENYFRAFAITDDLQPVDDVLANYDDIIPETYAASAYDSQFYAVPFLTGIFALERNCAVIESAGLDCDNPPQYWEDLLADVRQITQAGSGEYYGYTLQGPGGTAVGSAFRIAVYQSQLGALPCADDACTIPDFNRADTLPVYEFLRDLVRETPPGLIQNSNEVEVYEALFRGTSAYQIAGSWHPAWASSAGCDDCRYSEIPHPQAGSESTLLVGNVLYAAPANSQHPDLAREWLELLLSDEVQTMIFSETGRLPVRRTALESALDEADDATDVFIKGTF